MFGKKVVNNFYWHCSLTALQQPEIRDLISLAEELAQVNAVNDYNVIKHDGRSKVLSLLMYNDFFQDPFPQLAVSYRVDLSVGRVEKRNYLYSSNPPILHRKELLLPPNDANIPKFRAITEVGIQLGLFENPIHIGFKKAWTELIQEKGYQLVGDQFLPVGNDETKSELGEASSSDRIARHLTALSRSNLSAPIQCLARYGFLDGSHSVFDYGCGKGDDVRNLAANNIVADGWDPHYSADQPIKAADIVNLGFVINVIENYRERIDALASAYDLAKKVLVVAVMLVNQNTFKGKSFSDGVITQRNTFQKYYTQTELKDFLDTTLDVDAIPVAPGIFFIFKDEDAEQRLLLNRQRRTGNSLRVSQKSEHQREQRKSKDEKLYATFSYLIDSIWHKSLELGRLPDKSEIHTLVDVINAFGSVNKAFRVMLGRYEKSILDFAGQNRRNDLVTYFALQSFSKRRYYKHLEVELQRDIKHFFGDYQGAITSSKSVLFQIGSTELIAEACRYASEEGLGYLDKGESLHVHTSFVQELPALLRIYIGCATLLYGDILQSDLIKIHIKSGKLSLMKYDGFVTDPLPRLLQRVKIDLRAQTFDLYEYGAEFEPPYLYMKSRYINEAFPNYAEQLAFDEQLQALRFFDLSRYGPKPSDFRKKLTNARWEILGLSLSRSCRIPDIDSLCGEYLTYRQLIECGEVQKGLGVANIPIRPDSFNALNDLAVNILDPVIDYFGMIRLTYGFCSYELSRHLKGVAFPKEDQHCAHEFNTKKKPICKRLGAAVDFIVDDENMRDVADWLATNTEYDCIHFYGESRPLHISYGPDNKQEFVDKSQPFVR